MLMLEWQLACITATAMLAAKSEVAATAISVCQQAAAATAQGPEFGRGTYTLRWPGQVYDRSIARKVAICTDGSAAIQEAPAVSGWRSVTHAASG